MSEFENSSGVMMEQENVPDAAASAPETGTESDGLPFSDFTEEEPEQAKEPKQAEAPAKEPGWLRGRIDKAVQKAEQRIRAEMEAKYAPLREREMEYEAQELVKSGEFKSIGRAKEYVRMKNGMPPEEPAKAQEATPNQQSEVQNNHLRMLNRQVEKLSKQGIDVMSVFNSDEEIRLAVVSGRMDFYDVAEQIGKTKRVPPAVRSANNASAGGMDIRNMSDAQFQRLQRDLAAGKKFDLRR